MLRQNRNWAESEPTRCAVRDRHWRNRNVTNDGTIRLRHERDCQLSSAAQGIDDVLLGVSAVPRTQESSYRHSLYRLLVTRSLTPYPDAHRSDLSA